MHHLVSHHWLPGKACWLSCQLRAYSLDTSQDGCHLQVFFVGRGFHVTNGCHLVTLRLDTALNHDVGHAGVVDQVFIAFMSPSKPCWDALVASFRGVALPSPSSFARQGRFFLSDILFIWLVLVFLIRPLISQRAISSA